MLVDLNEEGHNPEPKILYLYKRTKIIGERSPFSESKIGYYEGNFFREVVDESVVSKNDYIYRIFKKYYKK